MHAVPPALLAAEAGCRELEYQIKQIDWAGVILSTTGIIFLLVRSLLIIFLFVLFLSLNFLF
jgi:hypothetical protein